MKIDKLKVSSFCDKAALFSIYAAAFFLPISKALIETFVSMSIVFFLVKGIINREWIKSSWFNLTIFFYMSVCLVSVFTSTNFTISSKTFIFKLLENIIFLGVVIGTLNTKKRLKNMFYVFLLSSVLLGVDGIFQYFTNKDFLRWRPATFVNRLYASFVSPNAFGCFLVSMIPYFLCQLFAKINSKKSRVIYGAVSFLLITCLILTISRGAWFAFMGSVLFMSIWLPSLGLSVVVLLVFTIFILQMHHPFLSERTKNIFFVNDLSGLDRKIMWQASFNMFESSPWIGIGLGTFMFNFKEFVVDKSHYISYAHNCYLQMLAETGIIGLLAFIFILAVYFYSGIRVLISAERTQSWFLLLASLGSLLGYCIQMGVDTIFYSVDLGLLFWLMLGFGWAIMENIKKEGA